MSLVVLLLMPVVRRGLDKVGLKFSCGVSTMIENKIGRNIANIFLCTWECCKL